MKTLNRKNFRIQQRNQHLKNILEENYYIELGTVDIIKMEQILSGNIIKLMDIVYKEIAIEGVGKITNDESNELTYQFDFLNSLRKKSSSNKLFLTCGVLHYNFQNHDNYAPIVLIPIEINFEDNTFIISSEPIVNSILLNELQSNMGSDIPPIEHNAKIYDIENYCLALSELTGFDYSVGNYVTSATVEYVENTMSFDYFTTQRSIYEKSALNVYHEYFDKINAVMPTNIYQKWVLLKINEGQSFVVDGKLGSGKTHTIINAIADAVSKKKHVLYVSQDMDLIAEVEQKLADLQMLPYTYNLCKGYKHQPFVEKPLEAIREERIGLETLLPISDYEEALNSSVHGCKYTKIISTLALIKNKQPDITRIPIDTSLENNEIKDVYQRLQEIEKILNEIEPLEINVWSKIEQYYDKRHIKEIVETTNKYFETSKQFNKSIKDYCRKYDIVLPESFSSAQKLLSEISTFTKIAPPRAWVDNYNASKINELLNTIRLYQDSNKEIKETYANEVIQKYEVGNAEELLRVLLHNHLSIEEKYYLTNILDNNGEIVETIKTIEVNQASMKKAINAFENMLEQSIFEGLHIGYTKKLYELLTTIDVPRAWVDFYSRNRLTVNSYYPRLKEKLDKYQELKEELDSYLIKSGDLTYNKIKNLSVSSDFIKQINNLFDKKTLKHNHITQDSVNHMVLDLLDAGDYIKKEVETNNLVDKVDVDKFVKNYSLWINFYLSLNEDELSIFKHQVSTRTNDIVNKQKFIETYIQFDDASSTLNFNYSKIKKYGIEIIGDTIMDKNNYALSWIKYLKDCVKVINELKILFKNHIPTLDNIIRIINNDKAYVNLCEQLDIRNEEMVHYLGTTYQALDTNCDELEILSSDYDEFIKRLKTPNTIKILFENGKINELIKEFNQIYDLSEKEQQIHNLFSRYFMGGKTKLLECSLDEALQIIKRYDERTFEVQPLFVVFEHVKFFEKLGLRQLCDGILKSKYSKGIADMYIYSTYLDYQNELVQSHPVLQESGNILLWLDNFNYYEHNYNDGNIRDLARGHVKMDRRNLQHLQNLPFNDYNEIIDELDGHKRIFLADIDIFNTELDLSKFDIVFADDIHLSSGFKYNRVMDAKQAILFGDSSRVIISNNNTFNQIPKRVIFRLSESYVKDNQEFGNIPTQGNQYIYDFSRTKEYCHIKDYKQLAQTIIESYYQDKNKRIDIIYNSYNTKLNVYRELINVLNNDFALSDEIIKILNENIRLVRAPIEASRINEETYFLYDDLKASDNILRELIMTYASSTNHVIIVGFERGPKEENFETEAEKLLQNEEEQASYMPELVALIGEELKERGFVVEQGIGRIDLMIRGKIKKGKEIIPNVGIIVEGLYNNGSYSIVEDYQYYSKTYMQNGWQIYIFFVDDIIENLQVKLDLISQFLAKKDTKSMHQLKIDDYIK